MSSHSDRSRTISLPPFARHVVRVVIASGLAVATPVNMVQATPPGSQFARDDTPEQAPVARIIAEAAQRFNIPSSWIRAVMRAESGGRPRAVSPKGALGLMQLMPDTWAAMSRRHGLGTDPFDIAANIQAGTAYLREMNDRFSDLPATLAAYNAGPGRVEDWRRRGRSLPAETRAYVAAILSDLGGTSAPAMRASTRAEAAASTRRWQEAGLFAAPDLTTESQANVAPPAPQSEVHVVRPDRNAATSLPDNHLFARVSNGHQP